MIKRISKYTLYLSLIVFPIILIVESLISQKFSFIFTLSFVIGTGVGLLNLFITDYSLSRYEKNFVNKPKLYFTSTNLLKFLIYGVVLFLCGFLLDKMTLFTCALGMLLNKIIIHYLYLGKDPHDDKVRTVDKLNLPKDLIEKLKANNFNKVQSICNVNRETLLKFLTEEEVNQVIASLKEFELFIKGELEAIIDDDECDDDA